MRFISNSVEETIRIGVKLAKELKKGDVIALIGDLGSGKTILTKGIAEGLGV
jgi:tRNA threonylcarbamoyladenosine biosynthesis protein TsaE